MIAAAINYRTFVGTGRPAGNKTKQTNNNEIPGKINYA
jgi:hypothetical protein